MLSYYKYCIWSFPQRNMESQNTDTAKKKINNNKKLGTTLAFH